jgi:hypothetical protein
MRRLLHSIVLLALAPIMGRSFHDLRDRPARSLPPPRVGGPGGASIPPVRPAVEGTPWPALLRTRRRMRNRLKLQQGHWQHPGHFRAVGPVTINGKPLARVESISVDGDWAEVTRTDGSVESGPKDLVLARAAR